MNKVIFALVLLGIFSCSFAALSQGDYSDESLYSLYFERENIIQFLTEYPGKCNYYGRILDPGTHQSPDKCIRIVCSSNGHVTTASCGKKSVQGCEPRDLVDKTKDYPGCCLRNFNCNGEIKQF